VLVPLGRGRERKGEWPHLLYSPRGGRTASTARKRKRREAAGHVVFFGPLVGNEGGKRKKKKGRPIGGSFQAGITLGKEKLDSFSPPAPSQRRKRDPSPLLPGGITSQKKKRGEGGGRRSYLSLPFSGEIF